MIGKLFKRNKDGEKSAVTGAAPLSPGVVQSILEAIGLKSIPSMPQSAHRLFLLTTNPNSEARDFVEVIESDESLSARILKIANSVYFDRGKGCKSISDAVGIIGMSELRCLLNATSLQELFPSRHRLRGQLWANDIATAVAAKILARTLAPSVAEPAFLAGLMHDVGKLLLLQRHAEVYEKIARRVMSEGKEFRDAELEEYPFDHTEVGQLIAERWHFEPDLIAAIRNHHRPWSELTRGSLSWLVKGADCISHSLGLGHGQELSSLKSTFREQLGDTWEALGIRAPERNSMENSIRAAFEEECELYNSWSPPR